MTTRIAAGIDYMTATKQEKQRPSQLVQCIASGMAGGGGGDTSR